MVHRDARLYAMKDKDPTQWAVQKNQNGRYFISSAHPSVLITGGTTMLMTRLSVLQQITTYQAKEVQFAEAVDSDTPFSKVSVFWDDQCLVVPDGESQPLMMLPQSACDPIILKFTEPLQWKTPREICENEESVLRVKCNLPSFPTCCCLPSASLFYETLDWF